MRTLLLVAFVTIPLAACAGGASSDAPPLGGGDSSDSGGGAPPSGEAGTYYDSGTDGGPASASDVAVTPPDAGGGTTDSALPDTGAKDAGALDTGPADTGTTPDVVIAPDGPVVLGESCTSPIDISAGGTFTVDTCTLSNSITATCGTTAAAGILRGVAPSIGSTYSITFSSGWVLEQVDSTCSPMILSCGATGTWGVSGATPEGYWYFAIEPASGVCGTTTVTVDRIM